MKTYIPGAYDIAYQAHRYLTRYQATLVADASAEKIAALTNLLACLVQFMKDWPKPPPVS